MSDNPEPPRIDTEKIAEAVRRVGESLARAGQTWRVQGAMGHMLHGDLAQAREALRGLPPERLAEVATAAAALSSLADEIAAETGEPG